MYPYVTSRQHGPPFDQRKAVGSTVHAKAINIMNEYECNRLYGSQKKVNMVEGVVVNVGQQITKQRRKQFYVISDYKNTDGSVNMEMLHIKSMVVGPVLVPVPVSLPATAPLLKAKTNNILLANNFTSVPDNHSTPIDPAPVPTTTNNTIAPALLPTTTTATTICPTIIAPTPDPMISTSFLSNNPTTVVPETDTTTTTSVYSNPHTQNAPVTDPNPPPQNPPVPDPTTTPTPVARVPDTPSHTTSITTVVDDCHRGKRYDSEYVIYLYAVPSLQWKFTINLEIQYILTLVFGCPGFIPG